MELNTVKDEVIYIIKEILEQRIKRGKTEQYYLPNGDMWNLRSVIFYIENHLT